MWKFFGFLAACYVAYCIGFSRGEVAVAVNAAEHPELCTQAHKELQPPAPLTATRLGYVQQ